MRFFKILALALLLVGQAFSADADEHLRDTWIEEGDGILSREYGLSLSFLSDRWNVFCKGSRSQPKVGITMRTVIDLCATEDTKGVAHISLYAENQSFVNENVLRPDSRNPLSFRYTESHPWKDLTAEQFLLHMTKSIGAALTPHRSRSKGEFRVTRFRAEERCGVSGAEIRPYKLLVEGEVQNEMGEESPVRHEGYAVFGFFSHLVEYDFVGEMGQLPAPVLRELYFTVVVYNDPKKTADMTVEGCEIIKKIASQARRN